MQHPRDLLQSSSYDAEQDETSEVDDITDFSISSPTRISASSPAAVLRLNPETLSTLNSLVANNSTRRDPYQQTADVAVDDNEDDVVAAMVTEDFILSDEDLDVSFFDTMDEEDTDYSQSGGGGMDLDTVAAFNNSFDHRSSINTASVFSINTASVFSLATSDSSNTVPNSNNAAATAAGASGHNNHPHTATGTTSSATIHYDPNEDTTTSNNTDEGYADDESDQKRRSGNIGSGNLYSQTTPKIQRSVSLKRRNFRGSSLEGGSSAMTRPPLSPTPPSQLASSTTSPPRFTGLLRSSSASASSPPPTLPSISASGGTAAGAAGTTAGANAANPSSVIPPSASLFRYLRSWGRTNPEASTSATTSSTTASPAAAAGAASGSAATPNLNLVSGEPSMSLTVTGESLTLTNNNNSNTLATTMNPTSSNTNTNNSTSTSTAAAIAMNTLDAGSGGDLTSDDDDDEGISIGSQEETSWVDDDEDMSDTSVDVNEHLGHEWDVPIDWNTLPMIPNRFCVALPQDKPTSSSLDAVTATTLSGGEDLHKILEHQPTTTSAVSSASTSVPAANALSTSTVVGNPVAGPLHYLDSSLLQNDSVVTVKLANEFVWEHGTLLQAVWQLLAERDQVGVEGSTDSTENIWKKGPLKKLSFAVGRRKHQRPEVAGAWKVKYIELRQGNLCYYEDSARTGRKTIHLRQTDTVVQESSYRGPGFVFELLVQGSPTRYWMASSEVERQAWIKAIQAAMIGNEAPRKNLDLQPYEESLKVYTSLRESLQQADSQPLYLAAIQAAMRELASLQVPVQWVQERIENDLSPILLGTLKPPKFGRSPQKMLKLSITEFWKNMSQTTFSINGLTVPKGSQVASERIVGALTRCILEFDKAFTSSDERDDGTEAQSQISELQAVSYARHILLTVLRSKERQDTSFVTRYLLENPGVVVNEQFPPENVENPVNMEVSFAGEDLPDEFLHSQEISAWVWTRTRRKNQSAIAATVSTTMWKHRHTFAVLSGTVLSYYAAASPRPHGLRGQLVLSATSAVRDEGEEIVPETTSDGNSGSTKNNGVRYILCITSESHQDRLLSFESPIDAAAWKEAIQLAIDSAGSIQHPPRIVTTTTTTPLMAPGKMLKGAERVIKVAADGTIQSGIRVIKGAKDGGIRVIKGAKDGGIRVIKTATGSGFKVIRGAVSMLRQNKGHDGSEQKRRRPSLQMLLNNTIVHGKREPTVQCVFHTTQTYMIRESTYTEHGSNSEQGTESGRSVENDGWISVQAKLYQAFLMSGGPSGRIARGDALVELVFVETKVELDDDASC